MRPARTARAIALAAAVAALAAGCDEDNPFRSQPPEVEGGASRVWELPLDGFPSGWDFVLGDRFFVGTGAVSSSIGSFVVDERADGTLVFRPYSTIVPALSLIRTGILDLGPVSFDGVVEVPEDGYSSVSDSTGVPIVAGHVYAFRLTRLGGGVVPINYAKLGVTAVDREFEADPRSRFVAFEWAYQLQPLNRRVVPEE